MFLRLILLLTTVPIVELYLILKVHHAIATGWGAEQAFLVTIGTIVATGVIGAKLASYQGLSVLRSIRDSVQRGELPTDSLANGAMILFGAALLLTPGFVTDAIGLSLLIPVTRKLYVRAARSWLRRKIERGQAFFYTNAAFPGSPDIIDVEPRQDE